MTRIGATRVWAFGLVTIVSIAVAVAYTVAAAEREQEKAEMARSTPAASPAELQAALAGPHLMFLESSGDTYRRVAVSPLNGDGAALKTELWCQRVYFAGGRGLCLGRDAYKGGAFVFDSELQVVADVDISGLSSRARVSADGRFGSVTVFVQGHSYSDSGFSTHTGILDMNDGSWILEDLEQLEVRHGDGKLDAVDRNLWGVTFVPGTTMFYATVSTAGETYLIRGDFVTRKAVTLRENVECPSLSPDGSKIAFKKRISTGLSGTVWELRWLDLETMEEHTFAETRNVDDQAEWIDETHIVYSLRDQGPPATIRPDLWVASTDGTEVSLLRQGAMSPAVVD